jgi:hypothetical protein
MQFPPAPTPANLHFSKAALGWLDGTIVSFRQACVTAANPPC